MIHFFRWQSGWGGGGGGGDGDDDVTHAYIQHAAYTYILCVHKRIQHLSLWARAHAHTHRHNFCPHTRNDKDERALTKLGKCGVDFDFSCRSSLKLGIVILQCHV